MPNLNPACNKLVQKEYLLSNGKSIIEMIKVISVIYDTSYNPKYPSSFYYSRYSPKKVNLPVAAIIDGEECFVMIPSFVFGGKKNKSKPGKKKQRELIRYRIIENLKPEKKGLTNASHSAMMRR